MVRLLVMLVFLMFLTGCAQVRPVIEKTDTVVVWETQHDTVLMVEGDTAILSAWFRCDSLNRVIMSSLETLNGRKVEQIVRWRDNYLSVTAAVDSEAVYFSWKDKHIRETSSTIQTVTEQVIVKKPPAWYKILIISESLLLFYFMFITIGILTQKQK